MNTNPAPSAPVICVVGARPNYMKVAPIIRAFAAHNPPIPTLLVHTGQHYDPAMKERLFADLEAGKRGQRPHSRRLGHGFGLVDEGLGPDRLESEQPGQARQKCGFLRAVATIGLAHADRKLEGQLTQPGLAQFGHRRVQAQATEQDVLVERDEVDLDLATERFGHLAHLLALRGVLAAVGKSGHQGDGDEGTGLLGVHAAGSW